MPDIVFILVFPVFWCVICLIIARGGWTSLATHYASDETPSGERFRFQSLNLQSGKSIYNRSQYSSCLTTYISNHYLYIKPWLIFRMGHRPLRIPLRDLSFDGAAMKIGSKFSVEKCPDKTMILYFKTAKYLEWILSDSPSPRFK